MTETTQEERQLWASTRDPDSATARLIHDADRLAQAEALLRRWKLADEADDKGLLDTTEYDRLIQERDAFLGKDGE